MKKKTDNGDIQTQEQKRSLVGASMKLTAESRGLSPNENSNIYFGIIQMLIFRLNGPENPFLI